MRTNTPNAVKQAMQCYCVNTQKYAVQIVPQTSIVTSPSDHQVPNNVFCHLWRHQGQTWWNVLGNTFHGLETAITWISGVVLVLGQAHSDAWSFLLTNVQKNKNFPNFLYSWWVSIEQEQRRNQQQKLKRFYPCGMRFTSKQMHTLFPLMPSLHLPTPKKPSLFPLHKDPVNLGNVVPPPSPSVS